MLFIIASTIIILLPVIAYLLNPLSNQKSLIFLVTILVFGGFVLNFISKKPFIGSWVQATQSESILRTISRDEEVDKLLLNQFISTTSYYFYLRLLTRILFEAVWRRGSA